MIYVFEWCMNVVVVYYYLLSCLFIIHSYLFVWLLYSLFEMIECCLPLINLSLKAFVWFPVFRNNTAYFGIYYWKAKWTMTLQLKTVMPVTRTSLFFYAYTEECYGIVLLSTENTARFWTVPEERLVISDWPRLFHDANLSSGTAGNCAGV